MLLTSCLTPCTPCLPPLYTICTLSDLLLSPYLHTTCHTALNWGWQLECHLALHMLCTPNVLLYCARSTSSCSAPGLHPNVLSCTVCSLSALQPSMMSEHHILAPLFCTRSPTLLPSSLCKRPYTEYPLVLHQICNPFGLLNYTKLAHKYPLICTRSVHLLPSFPPLGLHPEPQSTGKLNTVCFDAPGGPASGASLRKEWLDKLKFFSNERGVNRDVSGEKIFKITSSQ